MTACRYSSVNVTKKEKEKKIKVKCQWLVSCFVPIRQLLLHTFLWRKSFECVSQE